MPSDEQRRDRASQEPDRSSAAFGATRPTPDRTRQSILYWRKSLFDPDRFLTWLAPRLWFFWTRTFLIVSAGCIVLAALLCWANGDELASSFQSVLRWESIVLVWLTILVVTTCHEFAHGLTCKHYGGEVHEIGFLLLLLMPCFYCNVSDAWLFREKSKRLWVTLAGGYFELFLWALAVFAWRLTPPDTLLNYLAFVVLSVCGVRTLFNFNPLIKLDGYYLLSDWLEMPNLHPRALGYFKAHLRRLLWGAPRPAPEPRGGLLFRFGLATWLHALALLALMLVGLFQFAEARWGLLGAAAVALLGLVSRARRVPGDFSRGGENDDPVYVTSEPPFGCLAWQASWPSSPSWKWRTGPAGPSSSALPSGRNCAPRWPAFSRRSISTRATAFRLARWWPAWRSRTWPAASPRSGPRSARPRPS